MINAKLTPEQLAVHEQIEKMEDDGFKHYVDGDIWPGQRVRNKGEQYPAARRFGTAVVVAVMRKKDYWEQKYGRKNIEVLIKRDRDNGLAWWADYGTVVIAKET